MSQLCVSFTVLVCPVCVHVCVAMGILLRYYYRTLIVLTPYCKLLQSFNATVVRYFFAMQVANNVVCWHNGLKIKILY